MRAIVKVAPGPGMEVREVPTPVCGPSDVLIRVRAAGVCGTDLHIWEWDAWASSRLRPPVVIGLTVTCFSPPAIPSEDSSLQLDPPATLLPPATAPPLV